MRRNPADPAPDAHPAFPTSTGHPATTSARSIHALTPRPSSSRSGVKRQAQVERVSAAGAAVEQHRHGSRYPIGHSQPPGDHDGATTRSRSSLVITTSTPPAYF